MTSRKVEVKNNIGLHASPAAFFINEACSFRSTIWVEKGDRKANAKSLMSVLSLCARQGESLLITADGEDEVAAVDALEDLLLHRLQTLA